MMGNESSQPSGLEIDEKAVEVTDFWTHHSAVLHGENITRLSVFIGEPLVGGSLCINNTPLEKAATNLLLHRHPCILKYISSWNKGSKYYLAVEYVKPLAHVIATQTTLQICIGLHSILKAVAFLHENALASHNNICSASIYVTQDGNWKLAGFEYLRGLNDLSLDYLTKTRMHRYEKAIDPNEEKKADGFKSGMVDKYAFAVLVDEVLCNKENNDIPCLEEFRQYCKRELQHLDFNARPSFNIVLKHEFFTHNFIVIYSFLTELPLKSEAEKQECFTGLALSLRAFPEVIVARQLGELLLSRLVLLDKTAQTLLLPYILVPKQDNVEDDDHIFSESTFIQIIIPKLLHIFRVRDAQIRLLLLSHFKHFVSYFSQQQLKNHILPELLIGIKDTNDHLVSITLIALSDLVPILGAVAVVGGKRAKLFNDGRPAVHSHKKLSQRISRRNSNYQYRSDLDSTSVISYTPPLYLNQMLELRERPSPDGGEEEVSTAELNQSAEDDLENWSDWDVNESSQQIVQNGVGTHGDVSEVVDSQPEVVDLYRVAQEVITSGANVPNTKLPDISELDIKSQRNIQKDRNNDDIDFFQDMEPVIELPNVVVIDENQPNINLNINSVSVEEGWGDDLDWVAN